MRIEDDIKLDYSDVLIRPKRSTLSSRHDVDMKRTYTFVHSGSQWTGVPIMAANMDTVGTPEMHNALQQYNMITCPARHYLKSNVTAFGAGYNVCMMGGIDDVSTLITHNMKWKFVGIDVANGYTISVIDAVKSLREHLPEAIIVAGNVVTADMTQELILSGADIVKVGIGPGSVCTTRIQTGVGYPQLSAVIECADAAHGLGAHIIADGGCTCPGDVAKAFGGGADFVMLGGMFAGHDEGKGKLVKSNGSKYIEFYGSSSETANKKHYGGLSDYRSSEGRTVRVKYRGKINDTILNILGGVRSSCTYVGAPSLKQLSKCTTFVRVTKQFNDTFVK